MPDYDGSSVLEAIRSVQSAETADATIAALSAFVEHYGFQHIFLGQLVNPANVPLKDILYISDWPEELKAHRRNQMAILYDPVAICALRSKCPFRWAQAHAQASRLGARVGDMVHDSGISDGMMFPMHALHSISGGVSLGAGQTLNLSVTQVRELEIVCQTAYYHLEAMLGPFPYQKLAELTLRETEGVPFAAAGKSNWEIACILGIEEDTAKQALGRAGGKLGGWSTARTSLRQRSHAI